jgi:glycosyltransferase involved in cell wall biosynthesis
MPLRQRLRVALLATVVDFGGIERVLLTLLKHMEKDVELWPVLYTRRDGGPNPFLQSLAAAGVAYHAIHVDASRWKYLNPVRNIGETLAHLKAGGFDLVHTHGYRADLVGLIAARRCGIPIVSTCHGFIAIDRNLTFYNKLDVFLLRYFDRVIAVSERMKCELVEKGLDAAKIQVIANAIQIGSQRERQEIRTTTRARVGAGEEEFVFGFVGRLSEEKGLRHLLEAFSLRKAEDGRWRLVLVGDGPQREALEKAIGDLGLHGKVALAGFQTDTAAWYSAMDAFVLPSLTEGTPMVVLEAMAHGVPVIATSVGGLPALIASGENGILVPPAQPSELLGAMRSLAGDRELRGKLAHNAAEAVRRSYGVEDWVRKISQVYAAARRLKPHAQSAVDSRG